MIAVLGLLGLVVFTAERAPARSAYAKQWARRPLQDHSLQYSFAHLFYQVHLDRKKSGSSSTATYTFSAAITEFLHALQDDLN